MAKTHRAVLTEVLSDAFIKAYGFYDTPQRLLKVRKGCRADEIVLYASDTAFRNGSPLWRLRLRRSSALRTFQWLPLSAQPSTASGTAAPRRVPP
jgi:hypothetical protein